jgi:hypothetical protein
MRFRFALLFVISGLAFPELGITQVPMTNFCGTNLGVCQIQGYGPAGYQCYCGRDLGFLIVPANMGTVCSTQYGMCPVLPMYRGSICSCGAPVGRVI